MNFKLFTLADYIMLLFTLGAVATIIWEIVIMVRIFS
jgi:hypothetical protein